MKKARLIIICSIIKIKSIYNEEEQWWLKKKKSNINLRQLNWQKGENLNKIFYYF